ncbi:MAG: DEAD/DEAH box helicase [Eubacteriales bacterium]|nr:DEAD/DEAH box helicase [Eubacteriales bacterium]
MSTFDRYAPFIQDYIYQNNWNSLRAVQAAAADVIFQTDENLLLTASTASGKTEAAFFPILTLFWEDMPSSVGAIYIGPLKALINDQFSRLNDLCAEADIPVWHWHGDVSQSHKSRLLKHPSGILQITPESLEALLLHKHSYIQKLFGDLRFIVIDEVHSLMRGDRGGQTLCLIERLCRLAGVNPRRIGLSATIGDPADAGRFLSAGTGRRTLIPKIESKGITWRLSMEHFYTQDVQAADGKKIEGALEVLSEATDQAPAAADPGIGYIFDHTRGRKCLVFVNSREECEAVTTTLRQYCETKHEPDRFLIHHGNLSESYRETAEEIMKDETSFQTTVTTATLELGIDIGRLERAFQIDAPYTVSSFLQRMGRTGRRELPPEMWFVIREEPAHPRALLPTTIPWKLLQGIALIQCYLEERWVEPPRMDRLPYSLLYHQTMSTLASCGEMSPAELASRVLSLTYFRHVTQDDYRMLLRHLLQTEHLQRTEGGGLIVGLSGERVINNYKFYAVFQENEEYTVRSASEEIGTVVKPPPVGEKIALAGHVWTVNEIDHKRHLIYCELVKGKVPAYFGDVAGDIHTKILERMRQVLSEEKSYPYLMKNASARLASARHSAQNSGTCEHSLIPLGGNMYCFLPWLGTYSFLALERFLKIKCGARLGLRNMDSFRPYFLQFVISVSQEAFWKIIQEELEKPLDPMDLVYKNEVPIFDKYDEYLPIELVKKGFAFGVLDIEQMQKRLRQLCERYCSSTSI